MVLMIEILIFNTFNWRTSSYFFSPVIGVALPSELVAGFFAKKQRFEVCNKCDSSACQDKRLMIKAAGHFFIKEGL